MELGQQLSLLLGDFSHLSSRIRHLDYDCTACGERIEVRCSYLSFRGGEPTVDEFVDMLSEHVIPFCLPRADIFESKKALIDGDHVKAGRIFTALSERAKALFIKAQKGSSRSGEAGEIVLYILNEWILKAPQIVSKMYLKTNANMPVHGTDGIHARYDEIEKKLYLYWGESKAHATLSSALASALQSIKQFVEEAHEKREIQLISAYPDLSGMSSEAQQALMKYLDPYSDESLARVAVFSCLLIYEQKSDTAGFADNEIEKAFVGKINSAAVEFIAKIQGNVTTAGLGLKRFDFFLLPVPSVQGLRDKFQERIGWPK